VNTLATYDFNRGKSVESSLLVPKHCAEHRHDERGVSRPLSSRGRSPTTQKLATAEDRFYYEAGSPRRRPVHAYDGKHACGPKFEQLTLNQRAVGSSPTAPTI
jgi:hypothetical protein